MLGILTILLCLFSVSFHELGHAWAMRAVGVPIRTISLLGFPAFGLPYFSWKFQPKWQKDPIDIQLHPLILGAFVAPDEKRMGELNVRDSTFVSGAGPFASFVYGIVMLCFAVIAIAPGTFLVIIPATLALLGLLYLFRRFFCQYIVLALGVGVLVLFVAQAFDNPNQLTSSMGGPVMLTQQFHHDYAAGVADNRELEMVFFLPGLLSIALGLINAIPFVPLDGGHIALAYLEKVNKKAADIFTNIGLILFAILMVASVGGDINVVVDWFASLFK